MFTSIWIDNLFFFVSFDQIALCVGASWLWVTWCGMIAIEEWAVDRLNLQKATPRFPTGFMATQKFPGGNEPPWPGFFWNQPWQIRTGNCPTLTRTALRGCTRCYGGKYFFCGDPMPPWTFKPSKLIKEYKGAERANPSFCPHRRPPHVKTKKKHRALCDKMHMSMVMSFNLQRAA